MTHLSLRSALVGVALGAAGLLALILPSAGHAADTTKPTKIVVVDMQRAVMETEDGLRAQSTLRKLYERRLIELRSREEDLARKKEEIDKQAKLISKDALQRLLEDFERQVNELRALQFDYDRELRKKQSEITAPIFNRISGLVRKVAQRSGHDLTLDKQVVPYVRADLDITDMIIVMYNTGEEPAPEPASSAPAASGSAPAVPPPAPASASGSAPKAPPPKPAASK